MSNATANSLQFLFSNVNFDSESLGPSIEYAYSALKDSNPLAVTLSALSAIGALSVYKSFQRSRTYQDLSGPPASSFFFGHAPLVFSPEKGPTIHQELLATYGSACRMKGLLGEDSLWIADPRALHEIVVKGHDDFVESPATVSWIKLLFGPNVLTATGHRHKLQRKILNPVFTAKHMRHLSPTVATIVHRLEDVITSQIQADGEMSGIVDMWKLVNLTALDVIGEAGMGHSFNALDEPDSEYMNASSQLIPLMFKLWYLRPIVPMFSEVGPASWRRFVVDQVPIQNVQELKKVTDIMDGVANDIYKRKKQADLDGTLDAQVAAGRDIMTLLVRQNQVVAPEEQMSEAEVISHVNGLIFGGHDTTTGAFNRILYFLAQDPDSQKRLYQEVRDAHAMYGKDLDYDQLNSLTFLDAVIRESLRLNPPIVGTERVATKDWVLPLQYPVKSSDGKRMITEISVKKGTNIFISTIAANRDKQTWGEDADEFRPTRWLEPLPASVQNANVPGVFANTMSFLGGPRACLGIKFAPFVMKTMLHNLISSFRFELTDAEISWRMSSVVKPYARAKDGSLSSHASLPLRLTVRTDSD